MSHLLLFHNDVIGANSVTEADEGEKETGQVDLLAVPSDSLANIVATDQTVNLYFKDGNGFASEQANLAHVKLKVFPNKETTVVKALWKLFSTPGSSLIEFNDIISRFPVDNIREITSIIRSKTERFSRSSGGILTYSGSASVDTQTTERFIPMTGSDIDFASNIDPMLAIVPLAATLDTVAVRIGAGSVDAVVRVYKNASTVVYASSSTTWSSAGDVQIFSVNAGEWSAGDTFSLSIDQSTSVDLNYVVATVTFNL